MLDEAWRLDPAVAVRPEPFGALAYHFGNRRLTFLRTLPLVDVVTRLADCATVADALTEAGVDEAQWPTYVASLRALADSGTIVTREMSTA